MTARVEDLKLQRRIIKSAITRHQNAVNQFSEGDDVLTIESRLADLTDLFKKYDTVQSEIEILKFKDALEANPQLDDTAFDAENEKERLHVETQYYSTISKIKGILSSNNQTNSVAGPSTTVININKSDIADNTNMTQLKPLPLPTFTGKHTEWYTFYDSFKSLVGDDKSISDIRKFHYLRGCLKDDALRCIESLSVSNANYTSAISLLENRFANKRLIVQEHVTNILNIPSLVKTSHAELRQLSDTVNINLAALEVLELPVKEWDAMLIPIITEKFDYATKKEWQSKLDKDLPTYEGLKKFIEKRCRILESINCVKHAGNISNTSFKSNQTNNKPNNSQSNFKNVYYNNRTNPKNNQHNFNRQVAYSVQSKTVKNTYDNTTQNTNNASFVLSCVICKGSHSIYHCNDFLAKSVTDRLKQLQEQKICTNCFKANHEVAQCRLGICCKICGQRHHTMLHINEFTPSSTISTSLHTYVPNQVLLSTVRVLIADREGNFHNCRALLDQGSQVNIITASLGKKLHLNPQKLKTCISGINLNVSPISESVQVTVKSLYSDFARSVNCLIVAKITEKTPLITFDKAKIEMPPNVVLSDPDFNLSQNIDLLIGADLFWDVLIGGPIRLRKEQPCFQETKLGWVVGGSIVLNSLIHKYSCNISTNSLESQVERFWRDEEVLPANSSLSLDEVKCEKHFRENTCRNRDGRFVVKLPFKEDADIGDSHAIAINRFQHLERKFKNNPQLAILYREFMAEYLSLEHMAPLPLSEKFSKGYYLPHHAVFKHTINGPKIRVVFDASAPSSNGLSLNDILMTGPTIQQDLFSILCRFRKYAYILSADITKMYRMIHVHPNHQTFQRIIWRQNENDPIQVFKLKTVTYGTTCAPFLAVRCLRQLAIDNKHKFPLASTVIERDFYMDDLLTGADSLEHALILKNQVTQILASAGFDLCKWTSNNRLVVANSANTEHSTAVSFDKNGDCKLLGFHWNCEGDYLKYKVDVESISKTKITKRNILSSIAKIFDPLGLLNPIIVKGKILLQDLWTHKLGWDQAVPAVAESTWLSFVNDLNNINQYKIPRQLLLNKPYKSVELHGFSDASKKAYGACIYVKCENISGEVSIHLLCAKSRVAPLKTITLPRLELNAAVLLTNLMHKVLDIFDIQFSNKYFWTDSTIVIAWINDSPANLKQYVANRIATIQKYSPPGDWRHVRSNDNPADIVSRGATAHQLLDSHLWWHGPPFLKGTSDEWPSLSKLTIDDDSAYEENKNICLNVSHQEPELPVMSRFSSFLKLQGVIAYCLRFYKIIKHKIRNNGPITIDELNEATNVIVKYIQIRAFAYEHKMLISCQTDTRKRLISKISKLDPFIDTAGILRVGGRLKQAPISYDNKHPMLLPEKHHVTNLIIRQCHENELHAGIQATLAAIRRRFWPVGARNLTRKIVRSCIKCSKVNPKFITPKMGDLPKQRLQSIRPFNTTGVDFAGPFLIKEGRTRSMRKVKAYIGLFICFATKAVHLELVGDLTTKSFLACFKRFVARRGNVAEIFCDNGTNFVGAERIMFQNSHFRNAIMDNLSPRNIKFHFIPPRSPHFGGLWERAVRSVKQHLMRVSGDASLTYEEFYTLLTSIEACLNSRPITPLSEDPNDLEALTPGHFLIGVPLTSPAEKDVTAVPSNRLSRWERVQQIQQHFWARWRAEYFAQLQTRPKGQQVNPPNIECGTMVVLVDENLPPLKWRLGRVIETHPGEDGIVRVVTVRTASGVVKRAVKKVCVLPTDTE